MQQKEIRLMHRFANNLDPSALIKLARMMDYSPYTGQRYYISPTFFGALTGGGLGAALAPDPQRAWRYALLGSLLGGTAAWGLNRAYRLTNRLLRPFMDEEEPTYKPVIYGGGIGATLGAALAAMNELKKDPNATIDTLKAEPLLRGAAYGGGIGALGGLGLRMLSSF
jgi:hypothetical protein